MLKTTKEFIKLFGPLALGVTIVSAWFLHSHNELHTKLVEEQQKALVALISRTIECNMGTHVSNTQFLARLATRYLDAESSSLRRIEDAFSDFARSRQTYFSIRYLDQTGGECVRIDKDFAGIVVFTQKSMQQKKTRYYFQEIMQAGKNDVYMSNFDLNIEHGRFEIPYRPTLRFGSPIMDKMGKRRGVVVLNYEAKNLLDKIRLQGGRTGNGKVMLCNGDGYWMLGLEKGDEWGHLFTEEDGPSMRSRFPDAWQIIFRSEKSQFVAKKGLFTFDTVKVAPGTVISNMMASANNTQKRWKIITLVPTADLYVPWMDVFIVLVSVGMVLMGLWCWLLAGNRVRQFEMEAQLRDTEERTTAISLSSQDAIIMVDSGGQVSHWSPAAERMLGYSEKEVLGLNVHELLAPKDVWEEATLGLYNVSDQGQGSILNEVVEMEALRKDGSWISVELALSSFSFKGQRYTVSSMRDVTRRKKRELELKRSEEASRALINAPTESALLIESGGTIVDINEVGARRLGGAVEDIVGKNVFDLIGPELAESRKDHVASVCKTGKPVLFEDWGGGRRMSINLYPVKEPGGSVDRVALFARDVTKAWEAEAALVRSEQRFRDVSIAVGEFLWETAVDGRFKFVTENVDSVLGYSAAELIDIELDAHNLHPQLIDETEDFSDWKETLLRTKESFSNLELNTMAKDGRLVWLLVSGVPYFDENNVFLGYRGAAMNITDRKATEEALKASEQKLRALTESAYDSTIMVDANGFIAFWNTAAEQLFGYTEEEALGQSVHSLIAPEEDRLQAEMGMYQFAITGNGPVIGTSAETIAQHKDGTFFPVERSIAGFQIGRDWYAVASIRDITERKASEAKLRELATTDGLTGLYNRRQFMELVEQEFARSVRYEHPLALLMLDIDHFKKINDKFGHDCGDQVLQSFAKTSILALRNTDVLGRLGGEEFGVFLPETNIEDAREVAERLRLSIEHASIETTAGNIKITVSIGVSVLSDTTSSFQEMIKQADVALYEAKQSGRNCVILATG